MLLLGIGEVVARAKGYRPWNPRPVDVRVEPGGSLFRPHPTLGYAHRPGRYAITLRGAYTFHVTNDEDGLRATAPADAAADRPAPGIWIFGGSFVYGWSLNDDETFPWRVQEAFPRRPVVNFGVDGYGTIHSLIQFREALGTRSAPAVAVLGYAGFHDERNTFLRLRRKEVAPWNHLGPLVQPYARFGDDDRLEFGMAEVVYREFPLMRVSALAHWIESAWDRIEERRERSHEVSLRLVGRMARLAEEHGVRFAVATVTRGAREDDLLAFARSEGLPRVDLSLDYSLPGNTNRPWDAHPSARADRHFADVLVPFLRDRIEPRATPAPAARHHGVDAR